MINDRVKLHLDYFELWASSKKAILLLFGQVHVFRELIVVDPALTVRVLVALIRDHKVCHTATISADHIGILSECKFLRIVFPQNCFLILRIEKAIWLPLDFIYIPFDFKRYRREASENLAKVAFED